MIVEETKWKYEDDWENPFGFKGGLELMLRNEKQQILFENCAAPLLVIVGEEDNLYREAKGKVIIHYLLFIIYCLLFIVYHLLFILIQTSPRS